MILKIDVCECDCRTADEVMNEIAKAQGWENRGLLPDTAALYDVIVEDGRCGSYDVLNDELVLIDGEVGCLWNDGDTDQGEKNKWYSGETLTQFFDVATAIWGQNEDDEWLLYTE